MAPKPKATFDKSGQKYETPIKTDPLYRFYTSLYKQSKHASPMAIKWCLEHGVFTKPKSALYDAQLKMAKMAIAVAPKKADKADKPDKPLKPSKKKSVC
jgi:hypothetical protein